MRTLAAALLAVSTLGAQVLCTPTSAWASTQKKVTGKAAADKVYEKAKTELDPDLYAVYRLLDRIMSANIAVNQKVSIGIRSVDEASCKRLLGDSPICTFASELPDVKKEDSFLVWALQVAGASTAAPNAYAYSQSNRIVINKALDDTLGEDIEAKACVIAHELAHVQQDHVKLRMQALNGWNAQAADRISAAVKNAQNAQKSAQFWSALAMVANAASAGLNSGMGNYGAASSANLNNQLLAARLQSDAAAGGMAMSQLLQAAQTQAPEVFTALKGMDGLSASYINRTMKDVKIYLDEVNENVSALSRKHETEADELAVAYMARAGINPEACLRVVAKLHRGQSRPVAGKNDTHPGEEERSAKISEAIAVNAAAYRRARSQLIKPSPLVYRYDSRLEIATVYPRGQHAEASGTGAGSSVDRLLSQ